jgi:hypothetical protein
MEKAQAEEALDISMAVATGKLIFFQKTWTLLESHLKKARINSKRDREMIRRSLREIVNGINDDYFFIPPDEARSQSQIAEYVEMKIREDKWADKILRAFGASLIRKYPSLQDFL